MDEELYVKVLNRIQAQCVRREYCVHDVMEKAVKAMDGDVGAAGMMVASLVEDKFVDDFRYASAFAREKSSLSGWGPQKIMFMLSRKGIDRGVAERALEEIDGGAALRKLESAVAAKYRALADDPQCRLKLLRFALGRGYGYDEVNPVVEKIMRNGLDG